MEVEVLQRIPMSWEEYLERRDLERAEWVDGVAIVSPQPRFRHGLAVANTSALLKASLPGLIVVIESGLRMARSLRGPDVMVVDVVPETTWMEAAPVLLVEVLSPSTRSEDLLRKGPEYAEAGAGQYWVVDPDQRTLEVYELVDGRWEPLAAFDERTPNGEVRVGEHGVVPIDLADLLDG